VGLITLSLISLGQFFLALISLCLITMDVISLGTVSGRGALAWCSGIGTNWLIFQLSGDKGAAALAAAAITASCCGIKIDSAAPAWIDQIHSSCRYIGYSRVLVRPDRIYIRP
jgi:hypothetical protein